MKHKEYKKLHAEWYEILSDLGDHRQEIDFWASAIEEAGEPALELGSGTGRILIPLLERGYKIVGLDTSEDMMARCRSRCESKGLAVELHEQSMQDFSLPNQFGLIFLDSGGLGLFVSDEDIRAMFERVMAHLKPGGLFIFAFEPLSKGANRDVVSNIWGTWNGDWVKGTDDSVIAWRRRFKYNPDTHIWDCLFIVEKFIGGTLVESEANERVGRYYTIEEAKQYASETGFIDISITGWSADNEEEVIIRCKKPVDSD